MSNDFDEDRADVFYYENRMMLLFIVLVVSFLGWTMSCDQPLKRVQKQLDIAVVELQQ